MSGIRVPFVQVVRYGDERTTVTHHLPRGLGALATAQAIIALDMPEVAVDPRGLGAAVIDALRTLAPMMIVHEELPPE